MKAARFLEPARVEIQEIDIPTVSKDELLIRVKHAGICGTDLHIFNGSNKGLVTPDIVLGHEFAGIIEKIGETVSNFSIGDRVAIQPNLYCGHCHYCRNAKQHFCENWSAIGLSRDGGFQEYCAVPASAAYRIPDTVDFATAALFEPLSCVIHGIKKSNIQLGDTVILQGVGGIGLLFVKVLAQMGIRNLIVSDIDDKKLKLAKQNGATDLINVNSTDLVDTVLKITNGIGAQVFIDAAGLTSTIPTGMKLLENTGKILIFGVPPEDITVEITPYDIYKKEITIIGSYTNPYSNEAAISMLEKLDVRDLITDLITLDKLVENGFKQVGKPGSLKIQVKFED